MVSMVRTSHGEVVPLSAVLSGVMRRLALSGEISGGSIASRRAVIRRPRGVDAVPTS